MFSPADLWIVPPPSHSAWFARLDWYLNWQMCKGSAYKAMPPAAELFRLLHENGIEMEAIPSNENAPLLISAGRLTPAKQCVVLPYRTDLKEWLEEAKDIAMKLQVGTAQLFLPADAEVDKAEKIWSKIEGECVAHFTADIQEHP